MGAKPPCSFFVVFVILFVCLLSICNTKNYIHVCVFRRLALMGPSLTVGH